MRSPTSVFETRVLLVMLAVACVACQPTRTTPRFDLPIAEKVPNLQHARPVAPNSSTPDGPKEEQPARLCIAQSGLVDLDVPGFVSAIVSVPPDTCSKRPVLVVAHGAGDGPRWQCEVWSKIVRERGFVVCPRGTKMSWSHSDAGSGYFFRDHHALEKEVFAVLQAFEQRFGRWHAQGPIVYAGYSQGGVMGALMLVKHPRLFERVILVEGGEAEWDVPTATKYHNGGGKRVLLVCGRDVCNERARRSSGWLQRGGIQVRREYVRGGGHTYGGLVGQRLFDTFAWVVDGDDRWGIIEP